MLRLASTAFAVIALAGCTEPAPPAPLPPRVLGGVEVSGQTLATGRRAYKAVCESCHGAAGDGRGRLGVRQNPKPRDFAKGVIKFASVPAGELWVDDDVLRTLRHGLAGTQMIAIKLPEEDLRAVTQYIKTFSPRWDSESPGTPVEVPPAPELDEAQRAESLTRGRELYSERCARCHDHGLEVPTVWEEPAVSPKLVDYPLKAGASPDVLYRTLAAGIGGVDGKKGLAGELTPSDIWALVFYVQTLAVKAD